MDEEHNVTNIAWDLINTISNRVHATASSDIYEADLREALYTLSEGLDINIDANTAVLMWQHDRQVAHVGLDDKFKL